MQLARHSLNALLLALALGTTPAMAEDAEPLAVAASLRVVGASIDGERISELSGLAWDVEPIAASRLVPPAGSNTVDAEGLAVTGADDGIRGNSELLVATEGQPRVIRYTLAGEPLGTLALPGGLDDPERFRRSNAMLEAVAVHPTHGLLVAAEAPLEGERAAHHRVVAAERSWSFPSYPAHNARLKGMDVMDDGRLLVLERAESGKGKGKGKGKTMMVALREIDLNACAAAQACAVRELAVLDRADETDNFEGLTYLGDGRVMIVSDDRGNSGRSTTFTVLQRRSAAH